MPVLTSASDLRSLAALADARRDPWAPLDVPAPPALAESEVTEGLVSVVLATRDGRGPLRTCLDQLRHHTRRRHEVVVVDAGSQDGTVAWLRGRRDVRLVTAPRGTGQDEALNLGVQASRGDVVVLLDPSTVVHRFWLEGLLRPLEQDDDVVAVGARAAAAPGPQGAPGLSYDSLAAFRTVSEGWRRASRGCTRDTERLAGPCVAVRRSALRQTGLLPAVFDVDALALTALSARLRAWGRLVIADEVLVHREAATRWRSAPTTPADQVRRLRSVLREEGRPLLSATLIVKDEQRSLAVALASLRDVVDEIVVSDTGSTDRTLEIATAMGARVVERPWTDDFAAARNHAHAEARGMWALYLDADERLVAVPDESETLALRLLQGHSDAVTATLRHLAQDGSSVDVAHRVMRVLRRETLHWRGAVHETPVLRSGGTAAVESTDLLSVDHDGYSAEVFQDKDKSGRNLQLARADYARSQVEDGGRWRWKSAYELSRALHGRPGTDAEVEVVLRECLEGVPAASYHLRADALVRLCELLVRGGRAGEALEPAEQARRLLPHNARTAVTLALVHVALEAPEAALAVLEGFRPGTSAGVGDMHDVICEQVELPCQRARLLLASGRADEALGELVEVLGQHPGHFAAWDVLHDAVQTHGEDWAERLGELCAPTPERALAAYAGLHDEAARRFAEGLRRRGVDADRHTPQGRYREQLLATLRGHSPEVVAAAARRLEADGEDGHALALWERLPTAAAVQVARARCLLALDRVVDAADALDDLDVAALDGPDLLVVAAVAGSAGDAVTALAVLARLPAEPDLAAEARILCQALGVDPVRSLPDRLLTGIAR